MTRRPGASVAVTAGLAGFLFVASAGAAQGTDLRTDISDLPALVAAEQERAATTEDRLAALREDVEGLTLQAGEADGATGALSDEAEALGPSAHMTPVAGRGIEVSLDDAPASSRSRAPSVQDLVVHQQDVQAVVNSLWLAGAEGVMLMDQRLISTSAVRCVGNTLSLQGTPYSPPYVVTAVGDPDTLLAALESSSGVQRYREYVAAYGLGWSVTVRDDVELPGYEGPTDLQHATVAEADGQETA